MKKHDHQPASKRAAHTPTPWNFGVEGLPRDPDVVIRGGGGQPGCMPEVGDGFEIVTMHGDSESNLANAAFIVRACNAHDALVAALESARGQLSPVARFDEIDAALQLAKGE